MILCETSVVLEARCWFELVDSVSELVLATAAIC